MPIDFVHHDSDDFLRTWTLLEHLACRVPVDSAEDAASAEAAAWAHEAYTDHGRHLPAPTAEQHFPGSQAAGIPALMVTLEELLAAQLIDAAKDLRAAVRIRRALDHVRRADVEADA